MFTQQLHSVVDSCIKYKAEERPSIVTVYEVAQKMNTAFNAHRKMPSHQQNFNAYCVSLIQFIIIIIYVNCETVLFVVCCKRDHLFLLTLKIVSSRARIDSKFARVTCHVQYSWSREHMRGRFERTVRVMRRSCGI